MMADSEGVSILSSKWNPAWDKYDVNKIFFNYLALNKQEIDDNMFPLVIEFYHTEKNKTPLEHAPESWTQLDTSYALYRQLEHNGAFNVIKSQYPLPLHLDPHCRFMGLRSKTLAAEKMPNNFTHVCTSINAHHSKLDINDTNMIGADLHINYDEELQVKKPTEIESGGKAAVFFTPNRQMMHWGAADEPKTGAKYFYLLLAVFVVIWVILIFGHYLLYSGTIGGGFSTPQVSYASSGPH